LRVISFAALFKIGDVGIVIMRDMWNGDPVAPKEGAYQLLNAAKLLNFDFAIDYKIIDRPPGQIV